jgi:peptide/nickel transport system permease protein
MMARQGIKKQSYWRLVWRQFRRNRLALVGLGILAILFFVAIFAPFLASDRPIYLSTAEGTYWFANVVDYPDLLTVDWQGWRPDPGEVAIFPPVPHSPLSIRLLNRLEAPSATHLFGTDDRGRDVLSRIIWGTRISMSIGFVAVGIAVLIGVFVGAIAGYYRGWADAVSLRIIEIFMCFPTFFLILAIMAFLPPSIWNIMIILGLFGWTGVARLVRGEFLKHGSSDYAIAARATGLRDSRVMFRHILPNAVAPVLVSATFGVAGAILTESGLSFLGFGVPPPTASWGEILKQSQQYVDFAWWLVMFPGAAVFITVTAFNLVGDGLRDAMDPRLRQ